MKEKGMDELFYAIRKLHEEYGGKVVLDIVGFFEDEYKGEVEKLVEDGIAVFHGFKEDPRPYYKAADCIVLPSYHEGMSKCPARKQHPPADRLLQAKFQAVWKAWKTAQPDTSVR